MRREIAENGDAPLSSLDARKIRKSPLGDVRDEYRETEKEGAAGTTG